MNSPIQLSFSRRNFIKFSTLVGCSMLATVSCRSPASTEVSQRVTNTSNGELRLGFNLWPGAIP